MEPDAAVQDSRALRLLVVAASAYVAAGLIANVASVRVVDVFGWSIDAGTLTYPLTFTLRDVVHKVGGRGVARTVVVAGAAMNVVLALSLWAAAELPADLAVGPQREFAELLTPVTRIIVASILAQVVAELIDTEVYHRYTRRFGDRMQWGRVLVSNAISVPVDSVLFVLIAFADAPTSVKWSIVWANIVVKGATSLLSWPLIYAVPEHPRPPVPAPSTT